MSTQATTPARTPDQFLMELIGNFWLSRCVSTAARLGLADLVQSTPTSVEDLARETGTDASALYRLLRALASAGIYREHEGRRFTHTELSSLFRSDVPGTLRYTAISELDTDHYSAWENLLHSVRTGETAFEARFNVPVWEYYKQNPGVGLVFEKSMTAITERTHDAIVAAYPFAGARTILDVGGGEGSLLSCALEQNGAAKGILFDRPEVIALAERRLEGNDSGLRISRVGGDFFQAVPEGADLQMLKWIIHDWDDERAIQILRNCRKAIAADGRLLLIESVVPEANDGMFAKLMDLNMLVMTGGRERTAAEFAQLLQASGFRLNRVIPTQSMVSVIEAEPV